MCVLIGQNTYHPSSKLQFLLLLLPFSYHLNSNPFEIWKSLLMEGNSVPSHSVCFSINKYLMSWLFCIMNMFYVLLTMMQLKRSLQPFKMSFYIILLHPKEMKYLYFLFNKLNTVRINVKCAECVDSITQTNAKLISLEIYCSLSGQWIVPMHTLGLY